MKGRRLKLKLIGFIFLLGMFFGKGQNLEKYNMIYNKVFLETSHSDFNKAIEIADSLYKISKTPILKARSLMLSATLYQQTSELDKTIQYALKAEEQLSGSEEWVWKTNILGFLTAQYR